jgi:hypothetical protein
MGFQHLISEASGNHVTVVGRHDLGSSHPDVPAHLLEITNVDLDANRERSESVRGRTALTAAESEREAQALAIQQFLAD